MTEKFLLKQALTLKTHQTNLDYLLPWLNRGWGIKIRMVGTHWLQLIVQLPCSSIEVVPSSAG
jgi:hypothetical protein